MLARRGARVLLLDRARFPRPKLCGDTLNPGALAVLHRLGLDRVLEGALPIEGMVVTGEPSVRIVAHYGHGMTGRAIGRTDFDARLIVAAEAAEPAGEGAFRHENKMVDAPVVARARRIVELAEALTVDR